MSMLLSTGLTVKSKMGWGGEKRQTEKSIKVRTSEIQITYGGISLEQFLNCGLYS
jgi:hypothetical protein